MWLAARHESALHWRRRQPVAVLVLMISHGRPSAPSIRKLSMLRVAVPQQGCAERADHRDPREGWLPPPHRFKVTVIDPVSNVDSSSCGPRHCHICRFGGSTRIWTRPGVRTGAQVQNAWRWASRVVSFHMPLPPGQTGRLPT